SIRPCEVDLVRPATGAVEKKETDPQTGAARRVTLKTSLSVQQRCRYGRAKKQKFIRGEFDRHSISEQVKHKFAWDLDALTRDDDNKLHHKMAVIYIDGNGFGRIQKECCATAAGQKSFDAYIKGGRV